MYLPLYHHLLAPTNAKNSSSNFSMNTPGNEPLRPKYYGRIHVGSLWHKYRLFPFHMRLWWSIFHSRVPNRMDQHALMAWGDLSPGSGAFHPRFRTEKHAHPEWYLGCPSKKWVLTAEPRTQTHQVEMNQPTPAFLDGVSQERHMQAGLLILRGADENWMWLTW